MQKADEKIRWRILCLINLLKRNIHLNCFLIEYKIRKNSDILYFCIHRNKIKNSQKNQLI